MINLDVAVARHYRSVTTILSINRVFDYYYACMFVSCLDCYTVCFVFFVFSVRLSFFSVLIF